jgi:hypothetical protein
MVKIAEPHHVGRRERVVSLQRERRLFRFSELCFVSSAEAASDHPPRRVCVGVRGGAAEGGDEGMDGRRMRKMGVEAGGSGGKADGTRQRGRGRAGRQEEDRRRLRDGREEGGWEQNSNGSQR